MTVFDSRMTGTGRLIAEQQRTSAGASTNQVGWVAALVWPAVWTAVVAGALLGPDGAPLLWAGVAGVAAMLVRQGWKIMSRRVREANLVIDNAPGRSRVDA